MIRMIGMIDTPAVGMNKSLYDEAIKQTEASLGLSEAGEGDPHQKGEAWQTDSGRWSGKNKDGYIRSFVDRESAKHYASRSESDYHDPPEPRIAADKARSDAAKAALAKDKAANAAIRAKNGSWQQRENIVKTERRTTIESLLRSPRLKSMVKEEYNKILEDCQKEAPKIEKKLEGLRSKMCEDFVLRERKGTITEAAMEKRIQINIVSELIDVPVNELMLYFINHVKTANEHKLVEYHLGHVYFYAN